MIYYADTSWWLALIYELDIHHEQAWKLFEQDAKASVVWTPWQRVELFNGLHQMERAGIFEPGGAKRVIRRLEMEVRLGYWPHREFHWTRAVQRSVELAKKFGPSMAIRGMDLFHVAIALTLKIEAFLSFDGDQNAFAQVAGLQVILPEKRPSGGKRTIRVLHTATLDAIREMVHHEIQELYGETAQVIFTIPSGLSAIDESEILNLARDEQFDLAILVLNNLLYRGNRPTASIDLVRRLVEEFKLPVIGVYGWPDDPDYRQNLLSAGASAAFRLPFAMDEMTEAFRSCLETFRDFPH